MGEVLRRLWQKSIFEAEVLKSEFDAGGYDLVLTFENITRHIQLKVSRADGKRNDVGVSLRLAEKPSGCVVWIVVDDDLNLSGFRWFGSPPGQPLPDITKMAALKHTKGDAQGNKAIRAGHRILKRSTFTQLDDIDSLLVCLLGPLVIYSAEGS